MKKKSIIISLIACALVLGIFFVTQQSSDDEKQTVEFVTSVIDVATTDGSEPEEKTQTVEIVDEDTPLATIGKNTSTSVRNLTTDELDQIRTKLFKSVNSERTQDVKEFVTLVKTGNIRAKESSQNWNSNSIGNHVRPNGTDWTTVLYDNGISKTNLKAGEDLAKITMTAKIDYSDDLVEKLATEIHNSLMNSSAHKKVILNTDYQQLGVGVYSEVDDGKLTVYVTEHFKNNQTTTKSVSSLTYSKVSNYTYTGKQIKPSITVKYGSTTLKNGTHYGVSYGTNKSTGAATIKITGKGNYTGTKTITFYIVPKTPTSLKLTAAKKSAKVSFGKSTGASGYEIAYSTSKSKGFKTVSLTGSSKTITKLTSKKTYYVKVRAYKTVSGKKYYSAYTSVKSVKVK